MTIVNQTRPPCAKNNRLILPAENVQQTDKNEQPDLSWDDPIELYYMGDSIGAVAEGGAGGTVSYKRALSGLKAYPNGTDESDTARLFLKYCTTIDPENFSITDWYTYHTKHRSATTYGKTWQDHFLTIEHFLKKTGELDYDRLVSLSKDRGSNGNGCLALAYPIVMIFAERAEEMADLITAGTHDLARPTMKLLVRYFQGRKSLDDLANEAFPTERTDGWELTPLSHGCLWAAASIADGTHLEDVIMRALEQGGDVDSYLSLALLIWGVKKC